MFNIIQGNTVEINPHKGLFSEQIAECAQSYVGIGKMHPDIYENLSHTHLFLINASALFVLDHMLPNIDTVIINSSPNTRALIKAASDKAKTIIINRSEENQALLEDNFLELEFYELDNYLVINNERIGYISNTSRA